MPDRSTCVQRSALPPLTCWTASSGSLMTPRWCAWLQGVMKPPAGRTDRSWQGGASRTTWKPRRWPSISGGREELSPFPSTEHMWKGFWGTSISWGWGWGPHLDCQHNSTYKGAAETLFTLPSSPNYLVQVLLRSAGSSRAFWRERGSLTLSQSSGGCSTIVKRGMRIDWTAVPVRAATGSQ